MLNTRIDLKDIKCNWHQNILGYQTDIQPDVTICLYVLQAIICASLYTEHLIIIWGT